MLATALRSRGPRTSGQPSSAPRKYGMLTLSTRRWKRENPLTMSCAAPAPSGQPGHLRQRVEDRSGRSRLPAIRHVGDGRLHTAARSRDRVFVNDVGDERTASLPGFSVGDEQAVADDGPERPAQLRALALVVLVVRDHCVFDGLGRVDEDDPASEHTHGAAAGDVIGFVEGADQAATRREKALERAEAPCRWGRMGRHEPVGPAFLANSLPRPQHLDHSDSLGWGGFRRCSRPVPYRCVRSGTAPFMVALASCAPS